MANRWFKQFQGTLEAGVVFLFGKVTTSTSGTVASTACKGFSVVKTGSKTGRYTVTLDDKYTAILKVDVGLIGTADTGYTTAKGLGYFLRNDTNAPATTFDIQFYRTDTGADAEVVDGVVFRIMISLKNTGAF